ncbi:MAG: hypothetical protein IIT98_02460 [Kiritimatiellae bacterium]|nr:hypothetical protein [Kiritimatiellia bacterium]
MSIDVDQIYLSMQSPASGEYLTANVYTIPGVEEADGSLRLLSIGQLVMALCLQRAAALETDIVSKMNTLENTTEQLELMTQIETNVLEGDVNMKSRRVTYLGTGYSYYDFLTDIMEMDGVPSGTVNASSTEFLSELESLMDSKNSFSQQTMIELQSQTTKRDQAYDMVSNILKSINTGLIGNVNNI